jgi:hypothetical protein
MTDIPSTPKLTAAQRTALMTTISGQVDGRANTLASLVRMGLAEARTERSATGRMVSRHHLTDAGRSVCTALRAPEREAGVRAERTRLDDQKAEREARESALGANGKALAEHPAPVTDSGLRIGAPRDAEAKRAAEIESAVKSGDFTPFGGGHDGAQGHGPAIFRGRSMAPVQPKRGYAAKAGTMAGPTGRPKFDRKITDVPMAGGRYGFMTPAEVGKLSRTGQRAYWRKVKGNREAAERLIARSRTARKSNGR